MTTLTASNAGASLGEMIDCIDIDLTRIGGSNGSHTPRRTAPADTLAVDYLIEGSRLGSQVLRKKWSGSNDPSVLAAASYFSIKPIPGQWKTVCAALSGIPANGPRARKIIEDTRRLFGLFGDVAMDVLDAQTNKAKVLV